MIGDGPHGLLGSGSGDFDFYVISDVTAGQIITAMINTSEAEFFGLDSFLGVWDEGGHLVAFNDDDLSRLHLTVSSCLPRRRMAPIIFRLGRMPRPFRSIRSTRHRGLGP